ncbi:MAG: hypothetical protein J7K73_00020 [Nanoarchaeota archaeon]|nr:hypothetical protein [Nanoarchaeota archaeon]
MKAGILLVASLLVFSIVFATSISTDVTGDTKKVAYTAQIDPDTEKLDIAIFVPKDWEYVKCESDVAAKDLETSTQKFMGESRKMVHIKYEEVETPFKIHCEFSPKVVGDYEVITLWISPNGFDKTTDIVTIKEKTQSTPITGYVVKEVKEEPKENMFSQIVSKIVNIKESILSLQY